MKRFQFTPLREGRPCRARARIGTAPNFNSRPSARGDRHEAQPANAVSISIHAPPRGATCEGRVMKAPAEISIHAPPRGATNKGKHQALRHDFNSRPSARGDSKRCKRQHIICISIHAPPRGATAQAELSRANQQFQFTPLREGRHKAFVDKFKPKLFQFTPLREGRPQKICNFCKSFVQPLQISMA